MKIFVSLAMAEGEQHKKLYVVAPDGESFKLDGEHAQVIFESGEHGILSMTSKDVAKLEGDLSTAQSTVASLRSNLEAQSATLAKLQADNTSLTEQLTKAKNSG